MIALIASKAVFESHLGAVDRAVSAPIDADSQANSEMPKGNVRIVPGGAAALLVAPGVMERYWYSSDCC